MPTILRGRDGGILGLLTDDIYGPKPFTVRIEKGNFIEPNSFGYHQPRHALRLLFDISPYPTREHWTRPEVVDGADYWKVVEFVARRAPALDKRGTAMNDSHGSSCVVS